MDKDIRIRIAGATLAVSGGTIASLKVLFEWAAEKGFMLYLLAALMVTAAAVILWTIYFSIRRTSEKNQEVVKLLKENQIRQIEMQRSLGSIDQYFCTKAGLTTAFDSRPDWYRAIAFALKIAPEGVSVHDSTCGPRLNVIHPPQQQHARQEYIDAVKSRLGDIHYFELYSSNWQPEIQAILMNGGGANLRVIPCKSLQFLFSDFLVIQNNDDGYPGDVFLSGLGFQGGEINLWIRDKDVTTYFYRYFLGLMDRAFPVALQNGIAHYIANGQFTPLTVTSSCP